MGKVSQAEFLSPDGRETLCKHSGENDMTVTYALTASFLFLGLALMLFDVRGKLKNSDHETISMILIGTAMFMSPRTVSGSWFTRRRSFIADSLFF